MIDTLDGLRASPVVHYDFSRQLGGSPTDEGGLSWLARDLILAPVGGGEPTQIGSFGPLPTAGRLVALATEASRFALRTEIWDVLWVRDPFTTAAATTYPFTSSIPARGLDGRGARIICVGTVLNVVNWNVANTVTYTNTDGVPTRTAGTLATQSTGGNDVFFSMVLQSGDVGVRSVESATFAVSTGVSDIRLAIVRPLCGLGTFQDSADVYRPSHLSLPMLTPRLGAGALLTAAMYGHTGGSTAPASVTFSIALDA